VVSTQSTTRYTGHLFFFFFFFLASGSTTVVLRVCGALYAGEGRESVRGDRGGQEDGDTECSVRGVQSESSVSSDPELTSPGQRSSSEDVGSLTESSSSQRESSGSSIHSGWGPLSSPEE
jgi:hypothetical protein